MTRHPSRASGRSVARSAARLAAVQALYQHAMEGTPQARLIDEFHQHRLGGEVGDDEAGEARYVEAETAFFDALVGGVLARSDEIDGVLEGKLASGWTLARLDRTMLQLLRAGTFELMARPDVPTGSIIAEYLDIANAFFPQRETKFANGVLDAVAKTVR